MATSSRSGYFGMPCGAKKNLGRVEKFEKTRFFQYFYWRILEIYWNLKFWKKLSHKNAIKMIWGVLFLLPSRKISQTVAPLIKIVALFWQDFGATFWRFLAQKVAPSDSKHLASLIQNPSLIQNEWVIFISRTKLWRNLTKTFQNEICNYERIETKSEK